MVFAPANRRGFTLIELLVVVLLAGLVFGLLLPLWNKSRVEQRRAYCAYNLQQIGIAMLAYAADHDSFLPSADDNKVDGQPATWDVLLRRGYLSPNRFWCPDDDIDRPPGELPRSYSLCLGTDCNPRRYFIQGSRLPCPWLPEPATVLWVMENAHANNVSGGGNSSSICRPDLAGSRHVRTNPHAANYLFLDGHVEWLTAVPPKSFPDIPKEAPFQPCR